MITINSLRLNLLQLACLFVSSFGWPALADNNTNSAASTRVSRCCQSEVCCCTRTRRSGGWEVIESANFRIHHVGQIDLARQLIRNCEQQRWTLQKRWLHAIEQSAWTPKCDVYCYPTATDYVKLTRHSAESWGHVEMEIGNGRVWRRRLNVRSDSSQQLTSVAAHELTHVILADAFCHQQIPRWADEGIAILSEPAGRREEFRKLLRESLAQGRRFSLQELTSARSYPTDPVLTKLFYAQSGMWVEFLTAKKKVSGPNLLKLVSGISDKGFHATLHAHFPNSSILELEAEWKSWVELQDLIASSD